MVCVVGVLVAFSPEIATALNIQGSIKVAQAISCYLGITFGGFASGYFSQPALPPESVARVFMIFTALAMAAYLWRANRMAPFTWRS